MITAQIVQTASHVAMAPAPEDATATHAKVAKAEPAPLIATAQTAKIATDTTRAQTDAQEWGRHVMEPEDAIILNQP